MSNGLYKVYLLDQKNTKMRGSISLDPEGFASIYINPRLDVDQQAKTLEHELRHLINNDLHNDTPLELSELLAAGGKKHEKTNPLTIGWEDRQAAIRQRGLDIYGLKADDPFWDKLDYVWMCRLDEDRFVGVLTDGLDAYPQWVAEEMLTDIYGPDELRFTTPGVPKSYYAARSIEPDRDEVIAYVLERIADDDKQERRA